MGILSRLFDGDGASPDEREPQAEASAQFPEQEAATVPRPPPAPGKSPNEAGVSGARRLPSNRPKAGEAKSAPEPPAGSASDRARRSSPPSKPRRTSSKPPKVEVAPLPETDPDPAAAEVLDEIWALASELDAYFDASRRRSDRPAPPEAEPGLDSVTTEQDMAAIRDLFNAMAVNHMAQVRDLMLELGRVEVATTWVGLCEPAVQSMRKMCEKMELPELSQALDDFAASLNVAKSAPTGLVQGEPRERLLAAYARMMEVLPCAFELGSGREAMLVQLLLLQVPGVHKLTIDKLYAAGLHQLDAFLNAKPDELAAVAGIGLGLAERISQHFRDYRRSFQSVLAEPTPAEEHRRLADLAERLRGEHAEFERVSRAHWSPEMQAEKRRLLGQRRTTLSSIYVSLTRLGEVERVDALKKKPVARQLAELEAYLRSTRALG
jgi:hypothetical protein